MRPQSTLVETVDIVLLSQLLLIERSKEVVYVAVGLALAASEGCCGVHDECCFSIFGCDADDGDGDRWR